MNGSILSDSILSDSILSDSIPSDSIPSDSTLSDLTRSTMMLRIVMIVVALAPTPAMAAGVLGEYSFLHVTFGSVWHLFLFIFVLVMIPFALIIIMSWRFRGIKEDEAATEVSNKSTPNEREE